MIRVFTFPGQGSQRPAMLQQLPEHEQVADVVAQAEASLGMPLSQLDSSDALTDTVNVQLSLLISGVAWARYLQAHDLMPDYVLGLSIGAYPAAVVANSLRFTDALHLVALRAQLMKSAYPSGYGMLAITGAHLSQIRHIVDVLQGEGKAVYLANHNAPYQYVLSGDISFLNEAAQMVRDKGSGIGVFLDVSVPSHCALLSEQAEVLFDAFKRAELQAPSVPYVSAARARVLRQISQIRDDLAFNMAQPLHWHDSCQMLEERGVHQAIEMPPGSTLTSLFRKVLTNGVCYSVENTHLHTLLFEKGS